MQTITKIFRSTLTIATLILTLAAIDAAAATFTVTNTNDSGPGSLRDALAQTNSNGEVDTINFDPEFFATARTIVLAGELQITADGADPGRLVTINGPGADRLTISGNNAVRPFHVAFQASLSMSGMTVRDGNGVGSDNDGASGGGISCLQCTLTLTNMVIRNNTSPRNGGGIFVSSAKSFTLLDSMVTENRAGAIGGIWETGSAVKVIRNTTISNNTAQQHVGGASFASGTFTMENCLVTGNKAGTVFVGVTGGLEFYGLNGTVTDTVVSNNSAGFGTDGRVNPQGGGLNGGISADGGAMTFRRVTVSGNRTTGGGGGMSLRAPGSPFTVIDSLISGNDGGTHSGGIHMAAAPGAIAVINTTFAGNVADVGGAIRNLTDGLSVINSTFVNNVARKSQPFRNGGGDLSGGAIFSDSGGTVTVQNSILAGNSGPKGPDVAGSFTSNGYNIIGNTTNSTGFGATGDQLNVNPQLGALQNNGGPTLTVAPQANSPAINAGSNALAVDQNGNPLAFDQRGDPFLRIVEGTVDIGAFEVQPNTPQGTNVTVPSSSGDARVTFAQVTSAGDTSFTPITPSSAGPPPRGYTIMDNAPAYNITTTASYTPPVTVCFTVSSVNDAATFGRLRILHGENGTLVDRTILAPDSPGPDFATRRVCARVNSLSPFVTALAPASTTAAGVSVSGRVMTGQGRGVTNARVQLTDSAGQVWTVVTGRRGTFIFEDIPSGETYVASVASRRFSFASRVIKINDNVSDLYFTPEERGQLRLNPTPRY